MRIINWILRPTGWILVPRTSAKMLTESANIVESYWRSTGNGIRWMRRVADMLHPGGDEYKTQKPVKSAMHPAPFRKGA